MVYNKAPTSIEKASQYNNHEMKIKTYDGDKYKLYWIEEEDGNVVSIKNTERASVDKSNITRILPDGVTLEFALKHNVAIQIKTKTRKYDFIVIEEQDDRIKGLTKVKTGGDTLSVIIPIQQIEKIQLQDKDKSKTGSILIAVGAVLGVFVTIGMIGLANADYF